MKIILFAMFFGSVTLQASGAEPSQTTVSLQTMVADKYVISNGDYSYDKPVVQIDLYINYQNGFYIDIWNSVPFEGYNQNFGSEQDFGLGWEGSLSALGLEGTVFNISETFVNEPNLRKLGAGDVIYTKINLSQDIGGGLSLQGGYENYRVLPDADYSGGNLYGLGMGGSGKIYGLVNLNILAMAVYDSGTFGLDNRLFLRNKMGLEWGLTDKLTLILPEVNYSVPVGESDIGSRVSFTGGLAYQF